MTIAIANVSLTDSMVTPSGVAQQSVNGGNNTNWTINRININVNYVDIKDSNASPLNTWYADKSNSVNSGNNTGWNFASFAIAPISASASVTCNGYRVESFSGSINVSTTVTSQGNVIYSSNPSINAYADVTANANFIVNSRGSINAYAIVGCYANASYSLRASINGYADVTAKLTYPTWVDVPVGSNIWLRKG